MDSESKSLSVTTVDTSHPDSLRIKSFMNRTTPEYRATVIMAFRDLMDEQRDSKGRFRGITTVIREMTNYCNLNETMLSRLIKNPLKNIRYGDQAGTRCEDVVLFELIERFILNFAFEKLQYANLIHPLAIMNDAFQHFFSERYYRIENKVYNDKVLQAEDPSKISLSMKQIRDIRPDYNLRTHADGFIYQFEMDDTEKIRINDMLANSDDEEEASMLAFFLSYFFIAGDERYATDITIAFDMNSKQSIFYGVHSKAQNILFLRSLKDSIPMYLNYYQTPNAFENKNHVYFNFLPLGIGRSGHPPTMRLLNDSESEVYKLSSKLRLAPVQDEDLFEQIEAEGFSILERLKIID